MKYAIYRRLSDGSINYGKTQGGQGEQLLQRFHVYKACSSQFHNFMAMIKEIQRCVERAERIGQDPSTLSALLSSAWEVAPGDVVDQTIPLAQAAFEVMCHLEKGAGLRDHEGQWRGARFARLQGRVAHARKLEEPMPGSVAAMSDAEREALREKMRKQGWVPKF